MLVNEFYIIKNGKKKGPFNFNELLNENLEDKDLIFYDRLDDYTCLYKLPDLKGSIIKGIPFEVEDIENDEYEISTDAFKFDPSAFIDFVGEQKKLDLSGYKDGFEKYFENDTKEEKKLSSPFVYKEKWYDKFFRVILWIIVIIIALSVFNYIIESWAKWILSDD